jgi:hypothetical protein
MNIHAIPDEQTIKNKFDLLRPFFDERLCRLWAATEARALGYGGAPAVAAATGITYSRILVGLRELERREAETTTESSCGLSPHRSRGRTQYRVRRPGAGRKLTEVKDPTIVAAVERLLTDEIAGDPMSDQRWVRSSLRHIAKQLTQEGHQVSHSVVRRLLKNMGFSLKANKRKQGRPGCPERDGQFKYIAAQKQRFMAAGLPVISVDTKKKELVGEFRNNGRTWRRKAEEVHEHDFPGVAECRAVPLGIYDLARNEGFVYVGVSNATPEFTVHSLARWWKTAGQKTYPRASELLILADGGGSNGSRVRAWKFHLQNKLCDAFGLTVTVCHYPTGCSKWNPVEHRLFSYISINWAGKPLRTLTSMLNYIRGTTTSTGLKVEAFLDEETYRKAEKLSRQDVDLLGIEAHTVCPAWNYTLRPRVPASLQ